MNSIYTRTYESFYQSLVEDIKLKIFSEPDDYIIAQPTEDLVKFYLNRALRTIEFDPDKENSIIHEKYIKTIPAHQRDRAYQQSGDLKMECERIIVRLPLLPNPQITQVFSLRTNTFSLSGGPTISMKKNDIVFDVEIKGYQKELSNAQIENYLVPIKSEILKDIASRNIEINRENVKLEASLTQLINDRKEKLDADKKRISELVNLIKIPLGRKDGDIVNRIQIDTKPFVQRIKPKTSNEDYQLDRSKVLDIIKLMSNQCLQFEKTPKTYNDFGEENLRDLLLSNLNSVFEGKATGETFNNKGKTDIYLNIDKGNILVSECKFYNGKKLYHETIDQLLGYLTWRQNYGIMISFCTSKNFSKIINEANSIITSHDSYESSYAVIENSHFISKHTLPGDDYKYVEIHHLYYNLFVDK